MQRTLLKLLNRHPFAAYCVLAFALSWAAWLPIVFAGQSVGVGVRPSHFPGLLGPMLAALIITASTGGRIGLRELLARMGRWRVPLRWYAVALSPLAFLTVAVLFIRATGGAVPVLADFGRMGGLPEAGVLGVWALLVLVNGFGEETGWRGYATSGLLRRSGPLGASLRVALVWAAWHLPLFFFVESFQGFQPALIPGFFVAMACGAIVLTWLFTSSGGSVLMVALWHGTYNLASGTAAAHGGLDAMVSGLVMAQAAVIVLFVWQVQLPRTRTSAENAASSIRRGTDVAIRE